MLAGGDNRALYMLPEIAKISKSECVTIRPDHIFSKLSMEHKSLIKAVMVFALPILLIKMKIKDKKKIKFIYCTTCYAWDILPAVLIKFITGSEVICVSHDTPLQKEGYVFFRKKENMSIFKSFLFTALEKLQEFLVSFVDIPIAISEFAMSFFSEAIPRERILLSSNGVPSVLTVDEADNSRIYDVVYVGRVIHRKNIPNLLKALSLKEFSRNLSLAFISNSDETEIRKMMEENLLTDTVKTHIFHKATEKEKYDILKKARISINISKDENFSISTLESASSGTALILSDSDFFKRIYKDSAIYVDPDKPDKIRSALDLLLNNESLMREMQAKAIRIAERYKYENLATNEYAGIIDRISETDS